MDGTSAPTALPAAAEKEAGPITEVSAVTARFSNGSPDSAPRNKTAIAEAAEFEAGSGSEEDEEDEDNEDVVPLLAGREKRSNAGNRMQALLDQEVEDDAMFAEEADDQDFQAKDEEDVFDSDFGSTSSGEEAEDEDPEALEQARERAEKKKKASVKAANRAAKFLPRHMRLAAQAAAKAKKPATEYASPEQRPKKKRRLSPSEAVNGEVTAVDLPATTGTPIDTSSSDDEPSHLLSTARRTTSRAAALSYIEAVDSRLATEHAARTAAAETGKGRGYRRGPTPKKLTQAERIAEALETEEVNRARLREFYEREEERREVERRGGLVRRVINGPKVVWLSKRVDAAEGRRKALVEVIEPSAVAAPSAGPSTLSRPPEHPLDALARQQQKLTRPAQPKPAQPSASAAVAPSSPEPTLPPPEPFPSPMRLPDRVIATTSSINPGAIRTFAPLNVPPPAHNGMTRRGDGHSGATPTFLSHSRSASGSRSGSATPITKTVPLPPLVSASGHAEGLTDAQPQSTRPPDATSGLATLNARLVRTQMEASSISDAPTITQSEVSQSTAPVARSAQLPSGPAIPSLANRTSKPVPIIAGSTSQPLPGAAPPAGAAAKTTTFMTPTAATVAPTIPSGVAAASETASEYEEEKPDFEARTFLILENIPNPSKAQEMGAFFGTHTDWIHAKAIPDKNRLVGGRRTAFCAITGRPAGYRDPLTGLPYADTDAYRTLKDVLAHQFAWSDELQCFTGAPSPYVLALSGREEMAAAGGRKGKQKAAAVPKEGRPMTKLGLFERLAARDAETRRAARGDEDVEMVGADESGPEEEGDLDGEAGEDLSDDKDTPVKGKKKAPARKAKGKGKARVSFTGTPRGKGKAKETPKR